MPTLRIGVGAKCSILLKRIHPQNVVRQYFPVYAANERLNDCIITRQEPVRRNGRTYVAVFLQHPSLGGEAHTTLYTAKRWAVVRSEGDPDRFFDAPSSPTTTNANTTTAAPNEAGLLRVTNHAEDIAIVRGEGFHVDDDNEPAPENIPDATNEARPADYGLFDTQQWGATNHVDPMANNGYKNPPSFVGMNAKTMSILELFQALFPWVWLTSVLIPQTNSQLNRPILIGEFLRYLGLRFRMASVGGGFNLEDFWSTLPFNEESNPCPYNFRKYMSLKRFREITAALKFTDRPMPAYVWNKNMAAVFAAGWAVCLDESMSIWHSRWTCPGWVFCPRKPHDKGNEYH